MESIHNLIALDMDGTLLNSQGKLSQETIDTLSTLSLMNHRIVLASGRSFKSLTPFLDQLNLYNHLDYTICFNGAQVVHNSSKCVLYFKGIVGLDIKKGYEFATRFDLSFFAYKRDSDSILYKDLDQYVEIEQDLTNLEAEKLDITSLNDQDDFIKMTFTSSPRKLDLLMPIIMETFGNSHSVLRSHDNFIEIINPDASKGAALKFILYRLGIKKEHSLAFGDNDNDISMMEAVYYRFVMQNSKSLKLKNIATEIVPSNDDDGVSKTLRRYLLPLYNKYGIHKI